MTVHHNEQEQTFTVQLDGLEGELAYARPKPDLLDIQHTWVDEKLRGRHVGDALVKAALDYARAEKARIRPTCPFVQAYLKRHPRLTKELAENGKAE